MCLLSILVLGSYPPFYAFDNQHLIYLDSNIYFVEYIIVLKAKINITREY